MRIDTSGNSFDHHGSAHRITHGFHNHHDAQVKSGAIRSAATNASASEQITGETTKDGLSVWRKITDGAKNLWGRIWGDGSGGTGADTHGPTLEAAASVTQGSVVGKNPYFTAVADEEEPKDSFMQRVRIRFRELTNQLKKRFSGRFGGRKTGEYSGRGTLNSGEQKPKEDLRKHSRYREEGLEMDCVLTDDSYLMDSYDRSGGYSRLTTDTGAKNRVSKE